MDAVVDLLKNKVAEKREDHAHSLHNIMAPVVEEDDVVGFTEEAEMIKGRLIGGSNDTTFISIVGMAGLGKTTLTKLVFNDSEIHYEFFTRLWIYVSRSMNRRQIFMDIISRFTKQIDEYKNMSEEQLAEKIKNFLKGGKYFIVMDDVWCTKDWDLLKIAFPNNQKGSRVLVTTRDLEVARYVDSDDNPHSLKLLQHEESWELLQKKVFRKETCPEHLVSTGKSIAKKCNGLPLTVVIIAGLLDKNSPAATWKTLATDPFPIINQSFND